MALQVYSTLSRKKEPFHKKPGDPVSMYVCGPTVYKPSHIGHMVGPVIFDTVKRYLTYLGYKVTLVVNITDVDDKLIKRAAELKTTVPALAKQMTEDYFACLKALNVTGIDHFPRATEHVAGMIEVIRKLEEKGFAYQVDDGVYFDVSKDADYGALSNRDPEQMEAGARLEVNAKKRNPGDFALWKGAKPDEPPEVQYESPFKCGRGRPGWHIECTCMAIKMLGETLDIHGGGLDLQFPHHENELAQSESLTGKPFARFWMHNGLLKMGKEKMAGSVGNVVNIADLLKRHSAETVRFLLLSTHYRSPIEYSEERLDEIARSLQAFYRFFERYEQITGESFYQINLPTVYDPSRSPRNRMSSPSDRVFETPAVDQPYLDTIGGHLKDISDRFIEALDDDFNTAGAIGCLFDLLTALNRFVDLAKLHESPTEANRAKFQHGGSVLRELSNILGLFWQPSPKKTLIGALAGSASMKFSGSGTLSATSDRPAAQTATPGVATVGVTAHDVSASNVSLNTTIIEGLMQLLLDLRNNLRALAKEAAKDNPLKKALFDQTDLIRSRLAELGVTLEDRPGGTTWRVG